MTGLTYRSRDAEQNDKTQQEKLLVALDASPSQLRRDECGCWAIAGKHSSIQTWGDGSTWAAYVICRSARHWNSAKRRLGFMTVSQDGDDEGCLRLLRLPTPEEAVVIRDLLGLRKRRDMTEEALAKLEMARANSPVSACRKPEAIVAGGMVPLSPFEPENTENESNSTTTITEAAE